MLKGKHNILNIKSQKGFSLVEMLVAIGIFMSIMTIAISALISIIGANKKAQAIKSTIDSVTFSVEDISRDMRMGTDYKCSLDNINFSYSCLDSNGFNVGGTAVRYINSSGHNIIYTFNGKTDPAKGVLTKTDLDCGTSPCLAVDLISQDSNVNITNMTFYVIGADHELDTNITTKTQPRVIITASGLISVKGSADTSFNLQTNISQRARR